MNKKDEYYAVVSNNKLEINDVIPANTIGSFDYEEALNILKDNGDYSFICVTYNNVIQDIIPYTNAMAELYRINNSDE